MTSRFPGPWRIAEFRNGFAVYDATGRQLGFFYGRTLPRTNPDTRQTSFLMVDEARQIAVDFTRLPELLNQTSGRSEVAASAEDDKLGKLETNRSPLGEPETSRLLRDAQLSVITVTGSPSAKTTTTIRRSIPFELDRRRPTRMLRGRRDRVSIRTICLIAVVVLPAGYFVFGDSDPPVPPRAPAGIRSIESLPSRVVQAPAAIPPVEFLPLPKPQAPLTAAVGANADSRIDREVPTSPSQPTASLDTKPTENGTARLQEGRSLSQDESPLMPVIRISIEQERALKVLAGSRYGLNEELLLRGHGFSRAVLASLVRRRLAASERHVMIAGDETVEVVRLRITAAGRTAIEE